MSLIDIMKPQSAVLSNIKIKILGNAEKQTRGSWVRSKYVTSLCYAATQPSNLYSEQEKDSDWPRWNSSEPINVGLH